MFGEIFSFFIKSALSSEKPFYLVFTGFEGQIYREAIAPKKILFWLRACQNQLVIENQTGYFRLKFSAQC